MVVLQLHIPLAVYPLTLKRSLDLFATRQEGSDASKSKGRVEDIRKLSAFTRVATIACLCLLYTV